MKNYIMLDGQEFELDNALAEKLRTTINNQRTPFERPKDKSFYYFIDVDGTISKDNDAHYEVDDALYKVANYCTNKNLMYQRALHETLNRLLWRFSMENDKGEISWDDIKEHYDIYWSRHSEDFEVCRNIRSKSLNSVYFSTNELAKKAIDEIVKPFMAEHPDFVL